MTTSPPSQADMQKLFAVMESITAYRSDEAGYAWPMILDYIRTLENEHRELAKMANGMSCEQCSAHSYDKVPMFWYPDLGGWTRVFCDKHVPRRNGELCYGAKPLPYRPLT